ncbi:hypothetical protein D3C84_1205530 [compost metagenome]
MQRQTIDRKVQVTGQRRRQLHLATVAEHLPPSGAEQGLQRLQPFQLQLVPVLAQALKQLACQRGGQL